MSNELEPVIDRWYRPLDGDEPFRVNGIDEVNGLIEIQHSDGDVEEIDAGHWLALDLELMETPAEWTEPMDATSSSEHDLGEEAAAEALLRGAPGGYVAFPEDAFGWDDDD